MVGAGTSMALSFLDEHYGITDRVIEGLDDISECMNIGVKRVKDDLYKKADDLAGSVFDYAVDSARAILINAAMHALDRFLSERPRFR